MCVQGGWVAEVFRGPACAVCAKRFKASLLIGEIVKQKLVCYSSGGQQGY